MAGRKWKGRDDGFCRKNFRSNRKAISGSYTLYVLYSFILHRGAVCTYISIANTYVCQKLER